MLSAFDGTLPCAISTTQGGEKGIRLRIELNCAETGKNLTIGCFSGHAMKCCRGYDGRKCGLNDVYVMERVQEPRKSAAGLDDSFYRSSPSLEGWISGLLDPCILVKPVEKKLEPKTAPKKVEPKSTSRMV